jgi:hypothetical protein
MFYYKTFQLQFMRITVCHTGYPDNAVTCPTYGGIRRERYSLQQPWGSTDEWSRSDGRQRKSAADALEGCSLGNNTACNCLSRL